jgi:hypothetical protein
MMTPMTTQLRLLDPAEVSWRLDERTKEIGRRGLAQARAALEAVPVRPASRSDDDERAAAA